MNMIKFTKAVPLSGELLAKLNPHLCFWCACRHLGISNISFYKLTLQEAISSLTQSHADTAEALQSYLSTSPEVCGGCYGVLTHFTDEDFMNKVESEVLAQNVEFEHFCCSIALPVASVIRDYTYLLICADVCPDMYSYMPLEQIPTVKDVWKWKCGSKLEKKLGKKFALEHLDILIDFEQTELASECNKLEETFRDHFKKRKGRKTEQFTRNNVMNALQSCSRDKLRTVITYPPTKLTHLCKLRSLVCKHNPIYVAGRYNKYSRELSQSPWIIDGQRKGLNTSVSELLSQPVMDYTSADSNYFSSSGREDIDVQMLGTGRPFMIQVMNPRKVLNQQILSDIQVEINTNQSNLVTVRDLQIVSREACDELKDLEAEKRKTYTALCVSDVGITQSQLDQLHSMRDVVLNQMTPIRVLHRRALATRPRTIHWMKAQLQPDSQTHFTLEVETQGGTYVKEFVHSDFGRTVPNLGTLLGGIQCDILTLDVLSVNVDWPPSLPQKETEGEPVTMQTSVT